MKRITEIITVILLFMMQVKSQDITVDIVISGDVDKLNSTTVYTSLIDGNEDIQNMSLLNEVSNTTVLMDNETVSELVLNISTTFPEFTEEEIASSVTPFDTTMIITFTNKSKSTLSTTDEPTTTTTIGFTTISDVTSTIVNEHSTTTLTTKSKNNFKDASETSSTITVSSTGTEKMDSEGTTVRIFQIPTVVKTLISPNEEDLCSFMEGSFTCDEDIKCYGEGEIDCTDQTEVSLGETTFTEKILLTSITEESQDYENEGNGIETFPPHLVGVKPNMKKIPLFFETGILGKTTIQSSHPKSVKDKKYTTLTTVASTNKSPFTEELLSQESDGMIETMMPALKVKDLPSKTSDGIKAMKESTSTPYSSTHLTGIKFEKTENLPSAETEFLWTVGTDIQDDVSTVQDAKSEIETEIFVGELSTAETNDSLKELEFFRKKREENSEQGHKSLPFLMTVLESSKKIETKACKITGNLVCTPFPTTAKCKGTVVCQAIRRGIEKSEKSTITKGVETWVIAVIATCAITATFTVSLIIYLAVTSWKKLKVQPQNDVTTLTYVNSNNVP